MQGGDVAAGNARITLHGNGWYRCSLTANTFAVQPIASFEIADDTSARTYTGTGTGTLHLCNAMVNQGFPAPYLTTTTATVSRQLCAAGSMIIEAVMLNGNLPSLPLLSLWDGTSNDNSSLIVRYGSGGTGILGVNKTQGQQNATSSVPPLSPSLCRVGIAWSPEGYTVSIDGQTPQTVVLPWSQFSSSRLAIGRFPQTNGYLNGEIRRIEYRPTRLAAPVLQTLTAPSA